MGKPNGRTLGIVLAFVGTAILGGFGWLYVRSAHAAERIAVVETRQDATDATLLRIEAKLDRLLERP